MAEVLRTATERAPEMSKTRRFAAPRWAFAVLAAAAVVVAAFLAWDNARLRGRIQRAQTQSDQAPSISATPQLTTVALVLLPPRRGAEQLPELMVPRGTDRAAFDLHLEADDFPSYQVALVKSGAILWRSGELKSEGKKVPIAVPAALFETGNYILALSAGGSKAEPIANYAFRVSVK